MAEYRAIKVEKGSGGFGGPLTIQGTDQKNKVMYITGGGVAPDILNKIVELSGLEPVNGFKTSCPEEELALVIIDCGGTLRCGLYPKKRIPTININPVGKAGPLAQFIKEVIYVSGVTNAHISLADGSEAAAAQAAAQAAPAEEAPAEKKGIDTSKKLSEQMAESGNANILTKIGLGAGKVVATFNQAARNAVQTVINTLLPFMAFVCLLIGIIVKLITNVNTAILTNCLVWHKFYNIAVIRHNNIVAIDTHNVFCHLGIVLKHVEFAVVWHIVFRLHICHKLHMVFVISVTREVNRSNIRKVSLTVLNHLCAFAEQTANRRSDFWLVARNWVRGENNCIASFNLNIAVLTGYHAIQNRIHFALRTSTNNCDFFIWKLNNVFHLHDSVFRYFNSLRAKCNFNVINHREACKSNFATAFKSLAQY